MKISEISEQERPRERLLAKGAEALGNAELLAILLRTGRNGCNVLEIAHEALNHFTNLSEIAGASTERLMEIRGIGRDKAATIAAAFELGRRFAEEFATKVRTPVTKPQQIYDQMIPLLKGLDHEECWVAYLNRSNYIIYKERVSSGGLSFTAIDPNTILRKALEKKASGLILIHNHPSGNPYPGAADIKETSRLKKAAEVFSISLMDHIVISDSCFYSFSDEAVTHIT